VEAGPLGPSQALNTIKHIHNHPILNMIIFYIRSDRLISLAEHLLAAELPSPARPEPVGD
jgi:hypothetical protein